MSYFLILLARNMHFACPSIAIKSLMKVIHHKILINEKNEVFNV